MDLPANIANHLDPTAVERARVCALLDALSAVRAAERDAENLALMDATWRSLEGIVPDEIRYMWTRESNRDWCDRMHIYLADALTNL